MSAGGGVRLFVGGHSGSIGGEPYDLGGDRCFTAVHPPPKHTDTSELRYLLDSGAFSDPPDARLSAEAALERQLAWERRAADAWGRPVLAEAIASYDLLIDEVWTDGVRRKSRWDVLEAERAVEITIRAAHSLAALRRELAPRRLVLGCQGVTAQQYAECVEGVLEAAEPGDWIGYGGWCILGRHTSWLPEFRRTLARTIPQVAAAGVQHVHVYGVLWEPALAALLWIADQHGLSVSTDSTAPALAATRGNAKKAGLRAADWRANVRWWQAHLAALRSSRWYGPFSGAQQQALPL